MFSLANGIATVLSDFFHKLADQEPKYPLDWIILNIWALLSFISVDVLLTNISFGNSSSWKFFLFGLNIVPVLFFAADFNCVFNCVFLSLTSVS